MASGLIDSVNPPGATANASESQKASGSTDSVNPPGAANASRRLGSILLDGQRAFITKGIGSRRNETTATTYAMADYRFSVTLWMAEPPGISFFAVESSRPPTDLRPKDFIILPHVVGADGSFVLLRAWFCSYFAVDEYFMYKAGSGESPSLEWVPLPDDDIEGISLGRVSEFGVMPCDHEDHYLLAALCDAPDADAPADYYHLRIYSSETKAWSTRTLLNPCPGVRKIIPGKVIALREGSLGWVDFSCGLLACDDLRQDPVVRFIPLPEPLPENRNKVEASPPIPGAAARSFRDLACSSGVLKFFEMECHVTQEPTDTDVVYDSDLITSLKRNGVDEKKPKSRDCWRAVTWSRTVCSNFWCKECTLSGDDVLLDEPKHSALVSRLRGNACGKLTLSDLYSTFPTLSTDGDNILFFMSVAEPGDQSGWVVSVDLGNRTVKAAVDCSFKEHNASNQAFRPCTLSRYLNLTPGTEVSACRKIVQGSFAKIRTKAFVHALRPPFPSIRPLPHVESNPKMKELQSILLMAGKNKRARNESHSIVQKDHVSETQPVQTNLTMQQCVNKLDQPFNPVFEQLPPALLLPGYENSKQLWQQPSPSNMPFGAFRPHKAAQPCFNKWAGTSYLGYSEQLPAFNTFPYDTHSDYGTYQQQLQQPPSSKELPASASCEQPLLPPHQLTSCGLTS